MKIETTRFGSQEVELDSIIHFPNGLLSDPQPQDFKLFHKEDSESGPVVFWLQAINDPNIAYTIFDPALANFYYEVSLPDEDYDLLNPQDTDQQEHDKQEPDDIVMMVVITSTEDNEQKVKKEGLTLINANITEPLFINLTSKRGLQRSIKDLDYDIFLNVPVVETKG